MLALGRMRSLVQEQGGSTLVELLVALPFAMIVAIAGFKAFGEASVSQRSVEARSLSVREAQTALERMTRELRQARWVVFRSSQLVDMETWVRAGGSSQAVPRLVRYDCTGRSTDANGADTGAECVRLEGVSVPYPPPASPSVSRTGRLLTRVDGLDIFHPQRVDPTTGQTVVDFLTPTMVTIRLRMKAGDGRRVVEIRDGVTLRNATRYSG